MDKSTASEQKEGTHTKLKDILSSKLQRHSSALEHLNGSTLSYHRDLRLRVNAII